MALCVTAVLSACGGSSQEAQSASVDPAGAVPASAPIYIGAVLRPEGRLKRLATRDAQAITHVKQPFAQLDRAFARSRRLGNLPYGEDIEPWLGRNAGVFLTSTQGAAGLGDALLAAFTNGPSIETLLKAAEGSLSAGGLEGALLLDATDPTAAKSFVAKLASRQGAHPTSYRGSHYYVDGHGQAEGLIGKLVAIGSEQALHAVLDTERGGEPLSSSSTAYAKLAAKVQAGALAHVYLSGAGSLNANGKGGASGAGSTDANGINGAGGAGSTEANGASGAGSGPLASLLSLLPGDPQQAMISVVPRGGDIAIDADALSSSPAGAAEAAKSAKSAAATVSEMPASAWLAIGAGEIAGKTASYLEALKLVISLASHSVLAQLGGPSLEALVEHLSEHSAAVGKIFSGWAGSAGAFAAGTGLLDLQAGVVIDSRSRARATAAVSQLADAARNAGASIEKASIAGAEAAAGIRVTGLPLALDIAAGAGKLVIGLGPASVQSALAPSSTLSGAPSYHAASSALGGASPSALIDFPTMIGLLEGIGLASSPVVEKVIPYLESLGTLSASTQQLSGGISRLHVVLELQR